MGRGNNAEGQGQNGNIEESRGVKREFYMSLLNVPKGHIDQVKKIKNKRWQISHLCHGKIKKNKENSREIKRGAMC